MNVTKKSIVIHAIIANQARNKKTLKKFTVQLIEGRKRAAKLHRTNVRKKITHLSHTYTSQTRTHTPTTCENYSSFYRHIAAAAADSTHI